MKIKLDKQTKQNLKEFWKTDNLKKRIKTHLQQLSQRYELNKVDKDLTNRPYPEKKVLSKTKVFSSGEEPGVGIYHCLNCGNEVKLDDDSDNLPPCSECDTGAFRKE